MKNYNKTGITDDLKIEQQFQDYLLDEGEKSNDTINKMWPYM